ncbi:SGNH/GDSL hydrolase family protein [Halobacillus seohaensis]|uniref:SGNH/GDSL hydrolase family protein n=1 Tax=Halobacillus seohaensis TaxID=447421 RepID=A0ABW2EJP2_9BACI
MKYFKWLALMIFALSLLAIIMVTVINDPIDKQSETTSENTNEQSEQEYSNEEDPIDTEEEEEEESEEAVSEGIREVFSSVLDNARNLFIRDDLEVVAIGDSLTQGVGDSTENGGYIGVLEDTVNENDATANFTIDNFGKRGNRTDQLLTRMDSEEISSSLEEADVVLITIGANNVIQVVENNFTSLSYNDFSPAREEYQAQLEKIISKVEESNSNASIYLIGLYNPFNQYFENIPALAQIMSEWNDVSERVIDDHENASFIPIYDVFEGREKELLWDRDHFHPNEEGYKQMAERVLEYIREEIEQ